MSENRSFLFWWTEAYTCLFQFTASFPKGLSSQGNWQLIISELGRSPGIGKCEPVFPTKAASLILNSVLLNYLLIDLGFIYYLIN